MRILLTGMTNMQQNRIKKRVYNTSINALYHALTAAKHTVEWRRLEFDEQGLDKQYALIIIGLGTMSEFSCTALYETLLATQYDNVVYYVNDWKANMTLKLLRDGDIFREFVLRNNTGKYLHRNALNLTWRKRIERRRQQMFRFGDNLLGPFFSWGDRTIITDGTPFKYILEFNPSSFYLNRWKREIEIPAKKKKQWVYGALADYAKWHTRLNLSWPVLAYNKKTFIPEVELIEKYEESYGMLMPKYKASGSGWWRARYCHAMLCENVIYADPTEFDGSVKELYQPVEIIEGLSTAYLKNFAASQKERIMKLTPKWDHVVDSINEIVMEYAK